jgi:hypothetical protein
MLPDGQGEPPRRVRWAALSVVAGLAIGAAVVLGLALRVITARQAIGVALPAVLLTIGGAVTIALPGPGASHRLGFRAGLRAGTLAARMRSAFRGRRR